MGRLIWLRQIEKRYFMNLILIDLLSFKKGVLFIISNLHWFVKLFGYGIFIWYMYNIYWSNLTSFFSAHACKVHSFWKGHKLILINNKTKRNYCGLLRKLELYKQYQMKILDLGIRNQSSFHDDRIPFFSVWLSEQKILKRIKKNLQN